MTAIVSVSILLQSIKSQLIFKHFSYLLGPFFTKETLHFSVGACSPDDGQEKTTLVSKYQNEKLYTVICIFCCKVFLLGNVTSKKNLPKILLRDSMSLDSFGIMKILL